MRLQWGIVAVSGIVGCTGGEPEVLDPPETGIPTAHTGDTPTLDTATGPRPTVSPEDGLVDAPPLIDVIGTFSDAIDAAALAGATVQFEDDLGRSVSVTLRLEGTGTVVVDPVNPLHLGQTYGVRVSGLRWADGSAAGDIATSFTTHPPLSETRWERYTDASTVGSRELRDAVRQTLDPLGLIRDWTTFDGPGPDEVWNTPDDHIAFQIVSTVDRLGRVVEQLGIVEPGEDEQWNTADDQVRTVVDATYDGDVRTLVFSDAGGDGTARTADDSIVGLARSRFDPEGRLLERAEYGDPGLDGIWDTLDDHYSQAMATSYDRFGNVVQEVSLISPGADRTFFTGDDQVGRHVDWIRDVDGRPLSSHSFEQPGFDQTWFTADDVETHRSIYRYDANERQIEVLDFSGPGPDFTWGTADDDEISQRDMDHDEDGSPVNTVYTSAGPDRRIGTADDIVMFNWVAVTDDDGFVRERLQFRGPGVDGAWLTADDRLYDASLFEPPRSPHVP